MAGPTNFTTPYYDGLTPADYQLCKDAAMGFLRQIEAEPDRTRSLRAGPTTTPRDVRGIFRTNGEYAFDDGETVFATCTRRVALTTLTAMCIELFERAKTSAGAAATVWN